MISKKGVSPLVATILLIAFAVSLGAVVMNLGASITEGPCAGMYLEVLEVNEKPKVCVDSATDLLTMTLTNPGQETVNGVKIVVTGNSAIEKIDLEPIEPSGARVLKIPVQQVGAIDAVLIVPLVTDDEHVEYCTEESVQLSDIEVC